MHIFTLFCWFTWTPWSTKYLKHGFYIRWLIILICAHMEYIRNFDLLKALRYIERVVKSDFFSEKDLVYIIRAQREMSNHLI